MDRYCHRHYLEALWSGGRGCRDGGCDLSTFGGRQRGKSGEVIALLRKAKTKDV